MLVLASGEFISNEKNVGIAFVKEGLNNCETKEDWKIRAVTRVVKAVLVTVVT